MRWINPLSLSSQLGAYNNTQNWEKTRKRKNILIITTVFLMTPQLLK